MPGLRIIQLSAIVCLTLGLALAPCWAQGGAADRIGTVLAVDGTAEVRTADATTWTALRFRDAVFLGDIVRTGDASKLKVLMRDDSIITMSEQSEMTFTAFLLTDTQQRSTMNLLKGTLKVLTNRIFGKGSGLEVHTPNAVAGVRGTTFIIQFIPPDQTVIFVLDGTVTARNLKARIDEAIHAGTRTQIVGEAPPDPPVSFNSSDIIVIQEGLQLIEQVPEAVTPSGQLPPSQQPRGRDADTESSTLPDTSIVVAGDETTLFDIQQILDNQATVSPVLFGVPPGDTEPPVTSDTSPAATDAGANIIISFPQP